MTNVEENLTNLLSLAKRIRSQFFGGQTELCTIMNARSGKCGEDCKFCAQSSRYNTGAPVYPLVGLDKVLEQAEKVAKSGAVKFSIVTSGKGPDDKDFSNILEFIRIVGREFPNLSLCASLGLITSDQAFELKEAGLATYHHNIETSKSFYPKVCTTHSFESRIATILNAKKAGLEVCSGGILGMGETLYHRLEFIFILKDLGVKSIPINFLVPIPSTPLANQPSLSPEEILKTLAIFRMVIPDGIFRLCGGRERALGKWQKLALLVAANGLMVGNYLTTPGNPLEKDLMMVEEVRTMTERENLSSYIQTVINM